MTLIVPETRSTISSVFLEMRVWGLYCSCVRFRMACPPRRYLGLGIPQVSRLPLAFLRSWVSGPGVIGLARLAGER